MSQCATKRSVSRRAALVRTGALAVGLGGCAPCPEHRARAIETCMLIDDFADGDLTTRLGTQWEGVTDRVMGGVSTMTLTPELRDRRASVVMRGDVSLDNNGGFVQMATDLDPDGNAIDASDYTALELDVYGNDERYSVHLRTRDVRRPWQSYRAHFVATPQWQTIRLPLAGFVPYRLEAPFDQSAVRRLGIVAIGRAFSAELAVGRVALV